MFVGFTTSRGQDLGVVNRRAHDANSKPMILSVYRVYLAKRSTHKTVYHSSKVFNLDLENWHFFCRQMDNNDRRTQLITLLLAHMHACGITYIHIYIIYVCMHIQVSTTPPERPRLQLQPRSKPLGDTSSGRERGGGGRASSSIFGQAKPVDTAAREREIEERLLRVNKFSRKDVN